MSWCVEHADYEKKNDIFNMEKLIIKNIGPIKEAELDLNSVNVFIGPQSSGKSTIAKIISYCKWFEKSTILGVNKGNRFLEDLIEFHNLEECYFCADSKIEYTSNCFNLEYNGKKSVRYEVKGKDATFNNRKIEYIPAERNLVALPGIAKYTEAKNNIWNFIFDWLQAKKDVDKEHKYNLPLETLEEQYYYDKEKDVDYIVLKNSDKKILLSHASSGLLSVTPMLMVYDYVMKGVYLKDKISSPQEVDYISNLKKYTIEIQQQMLEIQASILSLQEALVPYSKFNDKNTSYKDLLDLYPDRPKFTSEFNRMRCLQSELREKEQLLNEEKIKYQSVIDGLMKFGQKNNYRYSDIIIEEPELNLFPKTQFELMYYMIKTMLSSDRNDMLTITTHSPYILFALNNCMMGGLVKDKIDKASVKNMSSKESWIDPKLVSIYEIHDGKLQGLQDKDGILQDNYLNQAYKMVMDEYVNILDYYEE